MKVFSSPINSLETGTWFKLICGASFQHLPAIRDLVLTYSLAGADCIDVAADPAVITMAKEAMVIAAELAPIQSGLSRQKQQPLLMVSVNDAEDPHFRKAVFDPEQCPKDCPRPCETICPAFAIDQNGVISDRCYGCGRCIPICPLGLIDTQNYVSSPSSTAELIINSDIDALEIHTQVGHLSDFKRLWQAIAPVHHRLKLLAISCQDHPKVLDHIQNLYQEIQPLDCALLWQTDGRPMSGDIGKGTIHASIHFAQKLIHSDIPGYVQLAGGTNNHTIHKLKSLDLFKREQTKASPFISGIAFGSYARKLLQPILEPQNHERPYRLEHDPERLRQAIESASQLVNPLKS